METPVRLLFDNRISLPMRLFNQVASRRRKETREK